MTFEKPYIQIAGIRNQYEADLIVSEGVKYIGFPLRLDFHEEDIDENEVARIIHGLPSGITSVLITYENNPCEIIQMIEHLKCDIIQFHGDIEVKSLKIIRRFKPTIGIVKSLIVENDNFYDLKQKMLEFDEYVDAYILDTYDPITKAKGATGKTHDWEISRNLVLATFKPVILAGGLDPTNVARAIREVNPFGVDVHSGIENEEGGKDRKKLRMFIQRAKQTFGFNPDK